MNEADLQTWRRARLTALADALGGKADLGRKLGYRDGAFVGQMIRGERPITEKTVLAAEAIRDPALGHSGAAGWFSPPSPYAQTASSPPVAAESVTKFGVPSAYAGDVTIPQYATGGAMGHGLVLEENPPGLIKSWHVDHEWLRLNVRHHTGVHNLCIVTGFGPSMRGMFNPGDPLLCDRGVTTVNQDAVFFFRVGDHGFIKMLQRVPVPGGGMIIRAKSKNPDFDPFDITPDMDFEVFGKILTVWKSEQL